MFNEPSCLTKVKEFHTLFDAPIIDNPTIPSKERCELRINLIQEELDELKEAVKNNDIVEIADAFTDIQYVLSGALLEFGMANKFEELFNEVHSSNMSKTCDTIQEAEKTVDMYLQKDGTESYIKEKGNKYFVYRSSDNKVLKSINYRKADLKKIINETS